ncbi:MAG: SDR family oxidoreductase [Wenzhouxiangellaceae bacterium]
MTGRQQQWRERYGPWAVISGASQGIGEAYAGYLAAAGFNLVLIARRQQQLEQLAARLRQQHSIDTQVISADLQQSAALDEVMAQTADLDVGLWIANAGFGTSGALVDNPLEQELSLLDVNCRALLTLTHHFARRFVSRGRGGIILLSSLLGFQGTPGSANYAASKAYVQALAEALRIELRPRGVDVLAVAPGPVRTGFAERADLKVAMAAKPEVVPPASMKALGRKATVRPGWLAKVLEGSLKLPRAARVRIIGLVMSSMTAHQPSSEQPDQAERSG